MAPAGQGDYIDISLIPLSAVERIELLTDGASAIYGSDAVGGVVNMILRTDFEGAETRARYGTVTQANYDEFQAGQILGSSWDTGHALVSYEYYTRSTLDSTERRFTPLANGQEAFDLIPRQQRNGVFANLAQRITDRLELTADVLYGERESSMHSSYFGIREGAASHARQISASLGLNADIAADWEVRATSLFGKNKTQHAQYSGDSVQHLDNQSSVWSAEVIAEGGLFRAPGGDVHLATGSQFRREEFADLFGSSAAELSRDVVAVYAEVFVPVVGVTNRTPGIERFELSVAARYEEYSDFGSAFNPKVGAAWEPIAGLNVRGTWGTSFKAPLLMQMNPANFRPVIYEGYYRDDLGATDVIVLGGSGVDLQPEESTNWTVGADLSLPTVPGLQLSATYFDTDYTKRVRQPLEGYDQFGVLLDPNLAAIVTKEPDQAYVQQLVLHPRALCLCSGGTVPENISAIVDQRLRNIADVQLSGVDFSLDYRFVNDLGSWAVTFGGTKLLQQRERIVPGTPAVDQLNDVWRPVDLRLRNTISFARGPVGVTTNVNYTDDYRDWRDPIHGPGQGAKVALWTTVDLTVQYDLGLKSRGLVRDAQLTLAATNLFDRDPPSVRSYYGMHFDAVNANPLGRYIAAQIVLGW